MSNKLNRDELLAKMEDWFEGLLEYGNNDDRQAYQQIKEMIQKSEVIDEDCIEEKKAKFHGAIDFIRSGKRNGKKQS